MPRVQKTASLPNSLQRQLNLYALAASAAGVSMLALAQPASARIVYTPAHTKLSPNHVLSLDLNHDRVNDFALFIQTGQSCFRGSQTCHTSFSWGRMYVGPSSRGNAIVGKVTPVFASALRAGVSIGPKLSFQSAARLMGEVAYNHRSAHYAGPWADSGKPVDNRYLGLKFLIKGKVHYGWARLDVRIYRSPTPTATAVLTGYAYETIANKPIVAGKTHGPDVIVRNTTLGALALGRK